MIEQIKELDGITFHDLCDTYPDYHIHVRKEQELLLQHKIIVWHHPFYWYSAPAIVKEWIDLVLEHGWAYGRHGTMLTGKKAVSVITTGGGTMAYQEGGFNGFTIDQFLLPFRQTAKLCHMTYLPPFVVHGTHLLKENDISTYALKYKRLLLSLRDDLFDEGELSGKQYLNELIE
jgi:glutathione-regulated potassium-efflux system ancillary protein KefG